MPASKKKPTKAIIQHAFDRLITNEICDFAESLLIARQVIREHPDMVSAKKLPLDLRRSLIEIHGTDKEFSSTPKRGFILTNHEPVAITPDLIISSRLRAREVALEWASEGRTPRKLRQRSPIYGIKA